MVEEHLEMEGYYASKIVTILEKLVGSNWTSKNQIKAFVEILDDLEAIWGKGPESFSNFLFRVVDLEGTFYFWVKKIELITVDEEKLVLADFEETVRAAKIALDHCKDRTKL
jgi:hypothetical protein